MITLVVRPPGESENRMQIIYTGEVVETKLGSRKTHVVQNGEPGIALLHTVMWTVPSALLVVPLAEEEERDFFEPRDECAHIDQLVFKTFDLIENAFEIQCYYKKKLVRTIEYIKQIILSPR